MEMQSTTEAQNHSSNYQKIDGGDLGSWYIISIISWSLMLITIWASYHWGFFWWAAFDIFISRELGNIYFPIQVNLPWLFIYVFLISLLAYGIYIVFSTCKKSQDLYDGLLGNVSKFHFVPLLLIASLNVIAFNSSINDADDDEELFKYLRKLLIFDLIFTILGLISLIFIYIVTELKAEWYIVLTIKKGLYSTFIIVLWYNFLHIIVCLRSIKYILDGWNYYDIDEDDNFTKFLKVIGIIFTLLFGLGSLAFSFIFKDIIAAFTNFLFYLSMVESFFNKSERIKKIRKDYFNGVADGVLEIIIMCLSLALIFVLILGCRERIF